jgi:hypothetical protein
MTPELYIRRRDALAFELAQTENFDKDNANSGVIAGAIAYKEYLRGVPAIYFDKDKAREENCEFCRGEIGIGGNKTASVSARLVIQKGTEVKTENGKICYHAVKDMAWIAIIDRSLGKKDGKELDAFKVNFCPCCGRDLREIPRNDKT